MPRRLHQLHRRTRGPLRPLPLSREFYQSSTTSLINVRLSRAHDATSLPNLPPHQIPAIPTQQDISISSRLIVTIPRTILSTLSRQHDHLRRTHTPSRLSIPTGGRIGRILVDIPKHTQILLFHRPACHSRLFTGTRSTDQTRRITTSNKQ